MSGAPDTVSLLFVSVLMLNTVYLSTARLAEFSLGPILRPGLLQSSSDPDLQVSSRPRGCCGFV